MTQAASNSDHPMDHNASVMALDVGESRIGVALANVIARLAGPLTTLPNDDKIFTAIQELMMHHKVARLIVGRPRNQKGEMTAQTKSVEDFVGKLEEVLGKSVIWQDESVTSVKAEAELAERGVEASKEAIDALAAVYILEDYLSEQGTNHE